MFLRTYYQISNLFISLYFLKLISICLRKLVLKSLIVSKNMFQFLNLYLPTETCSWISTCLHKPVFESLPAFISLFLISTCLLRSWLRLYPLEQVQESSQSSPKRSLDWSRYPPSFSTFLEIFFSEKHLEIWLVHHD